MANTGNEVSSSDSVSEILLKEQANKNDGGNKPPTYETLFSNTENPIQVHEQSQSRYQNIGLRASRAFASRVSLGSQSNESNKQHMWYDGQGCTLNPYSTTLVSSI
ncbi:unnamed protein product [Rotaria magnacalcarata]|uniref:Uncharacterized protein n=1 Tax=Rotaria magnacalcarata TaxID=392030 RepID=A0A820AWL0_9BILA|nr:unnamed protein product [Rotaria magnacalcarata]